MNPAQENRRDRFFRTELLLRELGYTLTDTQIVSDTWTTNFQDQSGLAATASINPGQQFLELGSEFSFSARELDFLRDKMESCMQTCYRFGCYFLIHTEIDQITITLFSKLYFSGLQYYALRETCIDLKNAVEELRQLFAMILPLHEGETNGHP